MGIPNQVQKELGISKHYPKAIDMYHVSFMVNI